MSRIAISSEVWEPQLQSHLIESTPGWPTRYYREQKGNKDVCLSEVLETYSRLIGTSLQGRRGCHPSAKVAYGYCTKGLAAIAAGLASNGG